jgi:hypothetical protein
MSQATPTAGIEKPKLKPKRKPFTRHDWIRLGILLWFVACWFIGSMRGQVDLDPFFELAYPEAAQVVKISDELHRA